jgi:hypothetical protein
MPELKTRTGFVHARGPAVACVASLLALSGCVGSGHATRPDSPTPATPTEVPPLSTTDHACPNLAGRYRNTGRLAPDTPPELCKSALHSSKYRMIGDWECDVTLTSNLAGMDASSAWVDVRQPDDDTLVVSWATPSVPFVELHRSKKEFDCTADGLTRDLKASMFSQGYDQGQESTGLKTYNAVNAAEMVLFASGGVQTLHRTFSKAANGSLLMHVERTTRGVHLLILPVNMDYSTWVTWPPDPPTESPPVTPAPPAGPRN